MSARKHTPGPWHAYAAPRDDIHNGPCVGSHDGDRIAAVIYRGDSETSRANAQLIAAAPGLLAALRVAEYALSAHASVGAERALETVRAAIAKAVKE